MFIILSSFSDHILQSRCLYGFWLLFPSILFFKIIINIILFHFVVFDFGPINSDRQSMIAKEDFSDPKVVCHWEQQLH